MKNIFLILFLVLSLAMVSFTTSAFALRVPEVTVAWTYTSPPTDLAGFTIHVGTSSGNYNPALEVNVSPSELTKVVNGLTEGQTYYFAVTAYDSDGNVSNNSTEVSATIPVVDNTPPHAPSGVTVTIQIITQP